MAKVRVQVAAEMGQAGALHVVTWAQRLPPISQRPDHRPYHLSSRIRRTLASPSTPASVSEEQEHSSPAVNNFTKKWYPCLQAYN